MTRRPASFAVPLALLLAGACDSPSDPVRIGDAYQLTSVSGEALPAIVMENEHATIVVLSDTLRFSGARRGVQVRHQEVTRSSTPETPAIQRYERAFGYRIAGDRIEIAFPCPPNANCLPPPHLVGRIDGDVMRLDSWEGNQQVYERVP